MAAEEAEFEITTTAQVERTYRVKAVDEQQAHLRLRRFIEDPGMARPDLISLIEDRTTDKTPQRVTTASIKKISRPTAVAEAS